MSERHVKATLEKQGKVFDPEIMKVILSEYNDTDTYRFYI
jgi:hypothetical protein